MGRRIEGLVVRVTGKEVWVEAGGEITPCVLRGRFRQKRHEFQIAAGDRVEVAPPESRRTQGAIEAVLPRRSWLSRYTGGRDAVERIIVANIDVLFVVESIASPELSYRFLDRVLVSAESGNNEIRICLNKIDLVEDQNGISQALSVYVPLGYSIIRTSAKTGEGVDEITDLLRGGVYAVVGRSGVGKSSLLNRIDPDLNLKVGRVAEKTGRGRHTTTYSQLFPIRGGYVADTPGMQTFGYPGRSKDDLPVCFPEFRPHGDSCRFRPCTHSHEPGCAVKEAVERGLIASTRYQSYKDMLTEVEIREKSRYT
ncbi:MAG: ribosome small subunit-dependent GTPase A [Candidatus Latescibacterota bacterium]|nr:MAG: ribosome small subunit-dependent GTPase A [Candidatus Latescibacterota bacterium]